MRGASPDSAVSIEWITIDSLLPLLLGSLGIFLARDREWPGRLGNS